MITDEPSPRIHLEDEEGHRRTTAKAARLSVSILSTGNKRLFGQANEAVQNGPLTQRCFGSSGSVAGCLLGICPTLCPGACKHNTQLSTINCSIWAKNMSAPKEGEGFLCPLCKTEFPSPNELAAHYEEVRPSLRLPPGLDRHVAVVVEWRLHGVVCALL